MRCFLLNIPPGGRVASVTRGLQNGNVGAGVDVDVCEVRDDSGSPVSGGLHGVVVDRVECAEVAVAVVVVVESGVVVGLLVRHARWASMSRRLFRSLKLFTYM